MSENAMSIATLIACAGCEAPKPAEAEAIAAQDVWAQDFPSISEEMRRKYFTYTDGRPCGRLCVKAYARLGKPYRENGRLALKKNGQPKGLSTAVLAKRVEEDLGVKVHFRGYSLSPEYFVAGDPWTDELYIENERRHVPGLDEDGRYERANAQEPLDEEAWSACACFMLNALTNRAIMLWGVEEDFARILSAPDFVHESYNSYLRELWDRLCRLITPETIAFTSERNDFASFEPEYAVREYQRAMRAMTGKEPGEPMLEDAWLLDPEMDMDYVRDCMKSAEAGLLGPGNAACLEEMAALILINDEPAPAPEWEREASPLDWDIDDGELQESLACAY